jgi:hypothetical protein
MQYYLGRTYASIHSSRRRMMEIIEESGKLQVTLRAYFDANEDI